MINNGVRLRVPCPRCGQRVTRTTERPAPPRLAVATAAALDEPPPLTIRLRRPTEEHHCAPAGAVAA